MLPVGDGSSSANVDNRRTKIVATLGPASSNEVTFRQLVRAGLDVARLNFSHGSHRAGARLTMVRDSRQARRSRRCPRRPAGPRSAPASVHGSLAFSPPAESASSHRSGSPARTGQHVSITEPEMLSRAARSLLLDDGRIILASIGIPAKDRLDEGADRRRPHPAAASTCPTPRRRRLALTARISPDLKSARKEVSMASRRSCVRVRGG